MNVIDVCFSVESIFFSIGPFPFFACVLKYIFSMVGGNIVKDGKVEKISTAIGNWLCWMHTVNVPVGAKSPGRGVGLANVSQIEEYILKGIWIHGDLKIPWGGIALKSLMVLIEFPRIQRGLRQSHLKMMWMHLTLISPMIRLGACPLCINLFNVVKTIIDSDKPIVAFWFMRKNSRRRLISCGIRVRSGR